MLRKKLKYNKLGKTLYTPGSRLLESAQKQEGQKTKDCRIELNRRHCDTCREKGRTHTRTALPVCDNRALGGEEEHTHNETRKENPNLLLSFCFLQELHGEEKAYANTQERGRDGRQDAGQLRAGRKPEEGYGILGNIDSNDLGHGSHEASGVLQLRDSLIIHAFLQSKYDVLFESSLTSHENRAVCVGLMVDLLSEDDGGEYRDENDECVVEHENGSDSQDGARRIGVNDEYDEG